MRKIIVLLIVFFMASCGPHRMRCGPKGICKTQQNQLKQEKNS